MLIFVGAILVAATRRPVLPLESDLAVMHPRPNAPLDAQVRIAQRMGMSADTMVIHLHANSPRELLSLAHRVNARLRSTDTVASTYGLATLLPNPDDAESRKNAVSPAEAKQIVSDFRDGVAGSEFDPKAYEPYAQFLERLLTPPSPPEVDALLAYPQLARTQLKTLLRLSQAQDIRILVPMVTIERDMQQMRELLVAVAHEMGIEKLPPLGAMIETPAAALTVGQIVRHADFLSVGTNDLTQYTMVAGRDNATVSDYYEETHPSMLRLLGIIIAEASGKPVTICGELAGREEVIPTLLEIGYRALSISPPLIPTTKELIRSIDTTNLRANVD